MSDQYEGRGAGGALLSPHAPRPEAGYEKMVAFLLQHGAVPPRPPRPDLPAVP